MINEIYLQQDNLLNQGEGSCLKINSVEIHGQEECEVNKGIFASDHYGLCCDMEFYLI